MGCGERAGKFAYVVFLPIKALLGLLAAEGAGRCSGMDASRFYYVNELAWSPDEAPSWLWSPDGGPSERNNSGAVSRSPRMCGSRCMVNVAKRLKPIALPLVVVLCIIALAGCSDGQQSNPEPAATATESPSPASSGSPGPTEKETQGNGSAVAGETDDDTGLGADEVLSPHINTSPDTGDREGSKMVVTDVRLGSHQGFDRVTFEVIGDGLAGWHVGYVDEAGAQGSGFPIEVEGDAVLKVLLSNIAYPLEVPEEVEPWEGPTRMHLHDSGPVIEVVSDKIYEGYQSFFVGVSGEQPFQVRRFESPQRIVLDVAAP